MAKRTTLWAVDQGRAGRHTLGGLGRPLATARSVVRLATSPGCPKGRRHLFGMKQYLHKFLLPTFDHKLIHRQFIRSIPRFDISHFLLIHAYTALLNGTPALRAAGYQSGFYKQGNQINGTSFRSSADTSIAGILAVSPAPANKARAPFCAF